MLKCFYCGRPLTVLHNDEGMILAKCTYPRCKLKPETDWEPDLAMVEADLNIIKESWKNK